MKIDNSTQLERYKKLLQFIDENFKEDIDIEKIEEVSHYSYRNINRIFLSLQHETIGKHIMRKRLEKAAEYLKYTEQQVSDIALNVGFGDLASFSKAFKKRFNCSPISFRQSADIKEKINRQAIESTAYTELDYSVEVLPYFKMLYVEHKGRYDDIKAIEKTWSTFLKYCDKKSLISEESIFFSESLDDNQITEDFNCRTHIAIIIDPTEEFNPEGLFHIKEHAEQKYARFVHKGALEHLEDTYTQIFSSWMSEIQLEFADKPTLLFRDYIPIVNKSAYESLKANNLKTVKNDTLRIQIISLYDYYYTIIEKLEYEVPEMKSYKNYFSRINQLVYPFMGFDSNGDLKNIVGIDRLDSTEKQEILSYLWRIRNNRKFKLGRYELILNEMKKLENNIEKELKQ